MELQKQILMSFPKEGKTKSLPSNGEQEPVRLAYYCDEQLKRVVESLVNLRDEYTRFAADHTRVSSMRRMAAMFTMKITDIIEIAVGKNGAS
jgi:hypothetical protein